MLIESAPERRPRAAASRRHRIYGRIDLEQVTHAVLP
jgi:hypothetical protein